MTNKDIFYKKYAILLVFLSLGFCLQAQYKVSKAVEESYALTNSGSLHLDNRYGDVNITGWESNTIEIKVDIEVSHKKVDNAKELLKRINPVIKANKGLITITSEINEKSSGFFAKYFNQINPFDLDKSNVKINYMIYLPFGSDLDITNKFGDVIISDWEGKLKTNVEHGDVWLNNDITNTTASIRFGTLHAKHIETAYVTLKNGGLDMEHSSNLRLNSSGSDIELGAVKTANISSSKDDIVIYNATTIEGTIEFSKVYVETLKNEMDVTAKIADITIMNLESATPKIYIEQESSEININVTGAAFVFNATLEQGLLRIPKSFKDIDTDVVNKLKKVRKINATYGNGPYGEFVLNGLKGIIVIKD